jgi:hypothetical protein
LIASSFSEAAAVAHQRGHLNRHAVVISTIEAISVIIITATSSPSYFIVIYNINSRINIATASSSPS